jgi:sortase A
MDFGKIPWRFRPAGLRSLSRWGRNIFLVMGSLLLGYCVIVVAESWVSQRYESWRFDRAREIEKPIGVVPPSDQATAVLPPSDQATPVISSGGQAMAVSSPSGQVTAVILPTSQPLAPPSLPMAAETGSSDRNVGGATSAVVREGDLLGRIEITRIGLRAMIMEGIDESTLRRAVGHIPGTARPGGRGNIGMAGHRDTFFRALRNIRKDDEITLTTWSGSRRYQVDSTLVVKPEDTEVLDDTGADVLTLVTCYPFSFLGSAPKRFIVRAHMISG